VQEILLPHLQVKVATAELVLQHLVVHYRSVMLLVVVVVELVLLDKLEQISKVEMVEQVLSGHLVLETTMLVVELDMEYLEHQALEELVVVETQTLMEQQILVAVAVLVELQEKQAVLV
jgi:hypothetical protein